MLLSQFGDLFSCFASHGDRWFIAQVLILRLLRIIILPHRRTTVLILYWKIIIGSQAEAFGLQSGHACRDTGAEEPRHSQQALRLALLPLISIIYCVLGFALTLQKQRITIGPAVALGAQCWLTPRHDGSADPCTQLAEQTM